MSEKKDNRLVENAGSFQFGIGTTTPPVELNFGVIVAGEDGATITTITLKKLGDTVTVYKYQNITLEYTWDGKTLGAGEFVTIPEGYRLNTLNLSAGYVKAILDNNVVLKPV